jgi:hypothetical protein
MPSSDAQQCRVTQPLKLDAQTALQQSIAVTTTKHMSLSSKQPSNNAA